MKRIAPSGRHCPEGTLITCAISSSFYIRTTRNRAPLVNFMSRRSGLEVDPALLGGCRDRPVCDVLVPRKARVRVVQIAPKGVLPGSWSTRQRRSHALSRAPRYDKPGLTPTVLTLFRSMIAMAALNRWVGPSVPDGDRTCPLGLPPFDAVVPPVPIRWSQIRRNGKSGRSCSPY